MQAITIFGGGAWGRALLFAFGQKNNCFIVSRRDLQCKEQISNAQAKQSSHAIIAISTSHLISWLESDPLYPYASLLIASKGISQGLFVNQIFERYYPKASLSFLAGPSFAKEVLEGLPCALNIHSHSQQCAKEWKERFPNFIKAYVCGDVIGGEIGGAYKNVIAIASGIAEGLGLGMNARASLAARGLVEMARFGEFFGAKQESFLGLSGMGDLCLSANSPLSRNFRVGVGLARGKSLEVVLEEIKEVAEGVVSAKEIYELALKHGIYTPIAKEVALIIKGKDIASSINDLMR